MEYIIDYLQDIFIGQTWDSLKSGMTSSRTAPSTNHLLDYKLKNGDILSPSSESPYTSFIKSDTHVPNNNSLFVKEKKCTQESTTK